MVDRGDELEAVLAEVAEAVDGVAEAKDRLVSAVRAARMAGVSYTAIGKVLGTSRQAAWERFSKDVDAKRP